MDKEVVKELIQDELTVENLKHELNLLLSDETKNCSYRKIIHHLKTCWAKAAMHRPMQPKVFILFLPNYHNNFMARMIMASRNNNMESLLIPCMYFTKVE